MGLSSVAFSSCASNAYLLLRLVSLAGELEGVDVEERFEEVGFDEGSGPVLVRTTRHPLQMNWYSLRKVRVRGGEEGDDSV